MRAALLALVVLAACDKDGGKTDKLPAALGGTGKDALVEGWKKDGLTVSALTADKSGAIGTDCSSGTVSGVAVVVCTFAAEADAKAAEAKGYEWVGETTGTVLVAGATVVAVADKHKADPTGRTINAIAKSVRGK
jgi:hypothetical protein